MLRLRACKRRSSAPVAKPSSGCDRLVGREGPGKRQRRRGGGGKRRRRRSLLVPVAQELLGALFPEVVLDQGVQRLQGLRGGGGASGGVPVAAGLETERQRR